MGMKTAVSVPNEVYEQAEVLAGRTGRSRSEIYSTALREYLARHGIGVEADRSVTSAGRSRLRDVEW